MIICKYLYNLQNTLFILAVCLLLMQSSCAKTEPNLMALVNNCPLGDVVESTDGIRRLALIIGVGQYIDPKTPDLKGAPLDARRFYKLLTDSKGYGFPKENVCLLLDAEANTENFKNKFTKALINRARTNDEVVIYYAGHGSQTSDKNGDEQDGMDETFVFHDARTGGIKDLLDDEFDNFLTRLYKKTQQITVFLDSCNSGSAMRGDVDYVSRYIPPAQERLASITNTSKPGENKKTGWVSSSLPGIVVFTAASDGTSALEKKGRGIFTDAILSTLGQINAKQLTYAQAARQIRPLVKAESYQIPYFHGNLQRTIFSTSNRIQPLSWEIITVKPQLKLGGFPLPGIGKGAEFRVYSGSVKGAETQDPEKAKAIIVLDESTGLNAVAHITSRPANAEKINPGDLAILSRPGNKQRLLKVTLRPELQSGGITAKKTRKIALSLDNHIDAKTMITLVQEKGDFELSSDKNGTYVVKGPENLIRSRFINEDDVIENLRQHAIQRVLSSLRGEGGALYIDQETIQVQIIPARKEVQTVQTIKWKQTPPNSLDAQEIPLGYKWNVKVKLSEQSSKPMLIGGLILSTDGSVFGFPVDGTTYLLKPGEEIVFAAKGETFMGTLPLNIEDQIIVFGTEETNPVPWSRLTNSTQSRAGETKNGLYRALDSYLSGTRGVGQLIETDDTDTAWTLSSISMRVIDYKK